MCTYKPCTGLPCNMYIQTLHRSADCFFEVQGGLSGKTSSEINSTKASDANRVPSTARSLEKCLKKNPIS